MNALVVKGLERLVSAYEAGAGCEDVGGGYCEGEKCKDCAALSAAAEWLDDRISEYWKRRQPKTPRKTDTEKLTPRIVEVTLGANMVDAPKGYFFGRVLGRNLVHLVPSGDWNDNNAICGVYVHGEGKVDSAHKDSRFCRKCGKLAKAAGEQEPKR